MRSPTKPSEDKDAALVDARAINAYLAEVLPAGAISTDEKTARLFETEPAIRHDPATGSYCWVAVNQEDKRVRVVFLLPLSAPAADHQASLAAALKAAAAAVPEAVDWLVWADFDTADEPQAALLKALTWQAIFTNETLGVLPKIEANRAGTHARISLPTLRQAIAVTEEWK